MRSATKTDHLKAVIVRVTGGTKVVATPGLRDIDDGVLATTGKDRR